MSTLKYWLWLASMPGLRQRTKLTLLDELGEAESIYFAEADDYKRAGVSEGEIGLLTNKELDAAKGILDKCYSRDIGILTLQDALYPSRLRNIPDPPLVLYVLGSLPAVDEEAVIAIAGTRRASAYGIKMGRRLGYEITKSGGLIVSGLAEGIDSAAAEGALRAGGSCIGVLGTAINVVYPKSNVKLFRDVAAVGAIVSEYPPDAPREQGTFPARNRILSGLSAGVCIIEAPRKSGSLITASRALEQGRDLFVVPGNADSDNSAGSNDLMKECAKAVTNGWDILCEYTRMYPDKLHRISGDRAKIPQEQTPPERVATVKKPAENGGAGPEKGRGFLKFRKPSTKKVIDKEVGRAYIDLGTQLEKLTERQLKLVAAMTKPSMHVDDITELAGLSVQETLAELTLLELEGYVTQERGKRFTLNIKRV